MITEQTAPVSGTIPVANGWCLLHTVRMPTTQATFDQVASQAWIDALRMTWPALLLIAAALCIKFAWRNFARR